MMLTVHAQKQASVKRREQQRAEEIERMMKMMPPAVQKKEIEIAVGEEAKREMEKIASHSCLTPEAANLAVSHSLALKNV